MAAATTMKLSDTDLERCDREWAERVLSAEEELLLVLKTKNDMADGEIVTSSFMGLAFAIFPVYCLLQDEAQATWEYVLVASIFILVGLGLLIFPWRKKSLKKRSMCLVTNRRVIHLFLSSIRKSEMVESYELRPNVQLEVVEEKKDGSGCLGFNYEDEEESLEYGGLLENVTHVRHVAEVLQTELNER